MIFHLTKRSLFPRCNARGILTQRLSKCTWMCCEYAASPHLQSSSAFGAVASRFVEAFSDSYPHIFQTSILAVPSRTQLPFLRSTSSSTSLSPFLRRPAYITSATSSLPLGSSYRSLHTVCFQTRQLTTASSSFRFYRPPQPTYYCSRFINSSLSLEAAKTTAPPAADPNFDMIFRFPHVMGVRMLCRLKIYQTLITVMAVPLSALTHNLSYTLTVGTAGTVAVIMLYIMGEFFRRFVGILYLSKDEQTIKVAHLTFWGRRHDQLIPLNDVMPLSELPDRHDDAYFKLRRYSCADTFNVSLKFGGIVDRERFEKVFGELDAR